MRRRGRAAFPSSELAMASYDGRAEGRPRSCPRRPPSVDSPERRSRSQRGGTGRRDRLLAQTASLRIHHADRARRTSRAHEGGEEGRHPGEARAAPVDFALVAVDLNAGSFGLLSHPPCDAARPLAGARPNPPRRPRAAATLIADAARPPRARTRRHRVRRRLASRPRKAAVVPVRVRRRRRPTERPRVRPGVRPGRPGRALDAPAPYRSDESGGVLPRELRPPPPAVGVGVLAARAPAGGMQRPASR